MVSWNSSWVLFAQRCVVVALGLVSRNVRNELYLGFSLQAVTHCVSLLLAIALQYKVPNTAQGQSGHASVYDLVRTLPRMVIPALGVSGLQVAWVVCVDAIPDAYATIVWWLQYPLVPVACYMVLDRKTRPALAKALAVLALGAMLVSWPQSDGAPAMDDGDDDDQVQQEQSMVLQWLTSVGMVGALSVCAVLSCGMAMALALWEKAMSDAAGLHIFQRTLQLLVVVVAIDVAWLVWNVETVVDVGLLHNFTPLAWCIVAVDCTSTLLISMSLMQTNAIVTATMTVAAFVVVQLLGCIGVALWWISGDDWESCGLLGIAGFAVAAAGIVWFLIARRDDPPPLPL